MLRYGLYLFGSYLTLFAHVDSLVLLTANFDDLKRIAQKLVPEGVVENIANFITRASEGAVISTDNEENYNYNKKSSRHKEIRSDESKDIEDLQSISYEATTRNSMVSINSIQAKALESSHDKGKKRNNNKYKQNYDSKTLQDLKLKKVDSTQAESLGSFHDKERKLYANKKKRKEKYDSKTSHDLNPKKGKSHKVYHPKKSSKLLHRITTKSETNGESELSGEYNNVDSKSISDRKKSIKKSKDITDNFNQYSDEEVVNGIFLKSRLNNNNSETESNEDKDESKSNYSNKLSLNQFNGDELKSKRKHTEAFESIEDSNDMEEGDKTVALTTRVEKNEFDQYVNLNYPKSELVATSGPLALTMVVESKINGPNFK